MLSNEDVKKVAKLSKFKLSSEEETKFLGLLSEALEYIKVLEELNTKNVEPTSQVTGVTNVLDEDVVRASLSVEEVLQNAPLRDGDYFVTDAVLKKGSSA